MPPKRKTLEKKIGKAKTKIGSIDIGECTYERYCREDDKEESITDKLEKYLKSRRKLNEDSFLSADL